MPGHIEKFCRNKGKPQCYHCKKYGHIEKFCRVKNGEQANYTEEKKIMDVKKRMMRVLFMHVKRRWRRRMMCGLLIAGVVIT